MSGEVPAKFEPFRRRRVRRSLAITVIAGSSSMLGACSGQSVSAPSQTSGTHAGDASGSGGLPDNGGGSSVGGSSVGGGGAGGTSTAMAGASGSGGNKPGCPTFAELFPLPDPSPLCTEQGLTCEIPIACSSGEQLLTVTCRNRQWERGAVGCNKPFDFCSGMTGENGGNGTGLYCNNGKWVVMGARGQSPPLKPCPAQQPAEALPCSQSATDYSVYDRCGYPCTSDPTKWTVFACINPPTYLGPRGWFSDGACD